MAESPLIDTKNDLTIAQHVATHFCEGGCTRVAMPLSI
jgi:hypothetical protein